MVASAWLPYNYSITISDFAPAGDGGFILAGTEYEWDNTTQTSHYYLVQVKLNNLFQTEWTRRTHYCRYLEVSSVEAANQAYFVLGTTIDAAGYDYNTLLVKTDLEGEPVWNKTFPVNASEYGERLLIGQHRRLWLTAQTQTVDYFYHLQMMLASATDPDALVNLDEPIEKAYLNAYVFPNPSLSETWLEFTLNGASPMALKIADQTGRIVWQNLIESPLSGTNTIKLPELPTGAFSVTVQSGTAVAVQKLVRVDRP